MTIENSLKNYILLQYRSILEFSNAIDLPYSTIASIFRRGVDNANASSLKRICNALGISLDELCQGRITPKITTEPQSDRRDLNDVISLLRRNVLSTKITLDGEEISEDDVQIIIDALDASSWLIKRKRR